MMICKKEGSTIRISHTLKGGTPFEFTAEEKWGGFEILFEIGGHIDPDYINLTTGEKMEALRLLKEIWQRFKNHRAYGVANSRAHIKAYQKLGFKSNPDSEFYPYDVYYKP